MSEFYSVNAPYPIGVVEVEDGKVKNAWSWATMFQTIGIKQFNGIPIMEVIEFARKRGGDCYLVVDMDTVDVVQQDCTAGGKNLVDSAGA